MKLKADTKKTYAEIYMATLRFLPLNDRYDFHYNS